MKKVFKKLLIPVIALIFVFSGLIGCGGSGWDASKVTLKPDQAGAVIKMDGFIAETENYVYFINGVGSSSDDNTFGAPVKGALVAAKKSDLTDTCVVVPKLFVASDYKSGLFIDNGYVYYGTPNTDKDSSGNIANSELTFARTKLDGTGFESFFSVPSLSSEYRFIKSGNSVYLVYFDTANSALVAYNTSDRTSKTIAKTSVEAEEESLTAGGYKFVGTTECAVVYAVDVYTDTFNRAEKDELGSSYKRQTASYNRIYSYKIGDESQSECLGTLIAEGDKAIPEKFTISFVKNGYVFMSSTDTAETPSTKTYALEIANFANVTELKNASYAVEANLIVSLNEVYAVEESRIVKVSLTEPKSTSLSYVAEASTLGTLVLKEGDYIYYYNSNSELARIFIGDDTGKAEEDLMEQRVSQSTVNTSWYSPKVVDGKIFYLDNSADGQSYVKYVSLTAELETEKDDDDNLTLCYLKGDEFAGVVLGQDKADVVINKINAISSEFSTSKLEFDVDEDGEVILVEGEPKIDVITEARAAYEALGEDKKYVTDSALATLKKYEEALRLNKIFYKLNGFDEAENKDGFEDAYNLAKAEIEKLKTSTVYTLSEMRGMLATNLNFFYQEADKYFNPSESK